MRRSEKDVLLKKHPFQCLSPFPSSSQPQLALFWIRIKNNNSKKKSSCNDKKWNCWLHPELVYGGLSRGGVHVSVCWMGETWERCNRPLCGFLFLISTNPSCFLIHAKWKENLLSNMQILMQSSVTYGARTAAFSFDLCFWHSPTLKKKRT